jgi:DNA polymerase sigma
LRDEVDGLLGEEIGVDNAELDINKFLMTLAEEDKLEANEAQVEKMDEHFNELRKIINRFSGRRLFTETMNIKMHLAKFGSIISGFATRNTDMDLTILTNCYIDETKLLEYLNEFLLVEKRNNRGAISFEHELIKDASIPLIKMKVTSARGRSEIDLIINNVLGVINSRFLSVYGSVKWIRQLGLLIKIWGKKKELIKATMFSSYSFNLMLIHFLIQENKANLIMDARVRDPQRDPHFTYKRKKRSEIESFEVYIKFNQNK